MSVRVLREPSRASPQTGPCRALSKCSSGRDRPAVAEQRTSSELLIFVRQSIKALATRGVIDLGFGALGYWSKVSAASSGQGGLRELGAERVGGAEVDHKPVVPRLPVVRADCI
jgi:hypothetical protein